MRRKSQYIDGNHLTAFDSSKAIDNKSRDRTLDRRNNGSMLLPDTTLNSPIAALTESGKILGTIKDETENETVSNTTRASHKNNLKTRNKQSINQTVEIEDNSANFNLPELPSSTKNKSKKKMIVFNPS